MALHLTDATFNEVVANNEVVLIDFSAAWCGPCKALSPVIDKISEKYEGKAAVCKMNIEECPDTTDQFGIRSVPTLIFIKNGKQVNKIVGATNESKITDVLNSIL